MSTARALIRRIEEIMDLEGDLALVEAGRKLINTIMILNNELVHIIAFDWDTGNVSYQDYHCWQITGDTKRAAFKTLDVFIPESGMYILSNSQHYSEDILIYLVKNPRKSWSKSFSTSGYKIYTVNKSAPSATHPSKEISCRHILNLKSFGKKDITMDKRGSIYYHGIHIADSLQDGILSYNTLYNQELKDWTRDEYGKSFAN